MVSSSWVCRVTKADSQIIERMTHRRDWGMAARLFYGNLQDGLHCTVYIYRGKSRTISGNYSPKNHRCSIAKKSPPGQGQPFSRPGVPVSRSTSGLYPE